jgi:hypothetical protein
MFRVIPLRAVPVIFLCTVSIARSQTVAPRDPTVLHAGTPLTVSIDKHFPMRVGQQIRAQLVYPIYVNNTLVLTEHTTVIGTVMELRSNHSRRVRATLGGDFTPFHIPVVHFTQIVLADGSALPISSSSVTDGAPIFRAVAPLPVKGGFLRRQFDMGLDVAREDLALFITPGRGDRLKQLIYGELPYHPQRIEKGTAWIVEITDDISMPPQSASPPEVDLTTGVTRKRHFWEQRLPEAGAVNSDPGVWMIQAYLEDGLSSETSAKGRAIRATVAEPIYNSDHTVAVPEGATLEGAVTQARPSRRFGRAGVLSFSFRQLTLPGAEPQNVETTLTGADSGDGIALNSEGEVKSKPQDKISVPILLALVASRPLDQDHHGDGDGQLGKNSAGGAAGLGLVGTIIGLAGAAPNAVAGIGYYGAAVASYYRWIAPGRKITFRGNTRIVVQTVARRSAPMKADPVAPRH